MNINDIKTESQLTDLGDLWYQRAYKLRCVWLDEEKPKETREKASRLMGTMMSRLLALAGIMTKVRASKRPPNFEKGGVVLNPKK